MIATAIAVSGEAPLARSTPQTQPPRGNAPSLVRSGKLSVRNGIMMPSTTNARIRLCARVTGMSETKLVTLRAGDGGGRHVADLEAYLSRYRELVLSQEVAP